MIPGQAPILFLFEWLGIKARTKGWKGWKHYVQVHRSYPICRRGCSVKHGSWSRCTRPTMVLLRALRRLRCSSCLSSDPIVQSFEAKVVPRFFVENAGASESLLNLSTYVLVSR